MKKTMRFRDTVSTRLFPSTRLVLMIGIILGLAATLGAVPLDKKETIKTARNPRITIDNAASGRLVVQGWDEQEAYVSVESPSENLTVNIERLPPQGVADRLLVTVRPTGPTATAANDKVDILVKIPSEVRLDIRQGKGPVSIEMLWGEISVRTVSGNITLTDVGGHLALHSMSGTVHVIRPTGRVEAKNVTGPIHFEWPESSRVYAETTTGKISYEGDFSPRGDYRFRTHSGEIELICPGSTAFDLQASTVRGRIEGNDFVSAPPPLGQRTSMSSFVGSQRAGNALVQLSTFSGTIRIQRQQ